MRKFSRKNFVDKRWANLTRKILRGNSEDVHTLYTALLTHSTAWKQMQKTINAAAKYDKAYHILIERVKYGWQHGILERPAPAVRFDPQLITDRRVRALLRLAQDAGHRIAIQQLAPIKKRHASHLRANEVAP